MFSCERFEGWLRVSLFNFQLLSYAYEDINNPLDYYGWWLVSMLSNIFPVLVLCDTVDMAEGYGTCVLVDKDYWLCFKLY